MTTPITEDAPKDIVDTVKPATVVPLNLQDRCDRCQAQAFVRASILTETGPSELLFCGHHFSKYEPKLREIALSVQDERQRINEKPSGSANAD
jgi:hypothetical protein